MSDLKKFSMLIVDDNEDLLEMTSHYLRTRFGQVKTARDGEFALELLRQESFDLIMTDIFMPRVGGIDLLIAARQLGLKMPVVMLTGSDDPTVATRAMSLGAFDLLKKPFAPDTLINIARRAIDFGLSSGTLSSDKATAPAAAMAVHTTK